MAPRKSTGRGALRSRKAEVMPNAYSPSVVQRLEHRAFTGRALDITVHQHFGFRMHYEWNGALGNWCFKRRFRSYDSLACVCTTLVIGTPESLCCCTLVREEVHGYHRWMFGHVFHLLYGKMVVCGRVLNYVVPPRLFGEERSLESELYKQEREGPRPPAVVEGGRRGDCTLLKIYIYLVFCLVIGM